MKRGIVDQGNSVNRITAPEMTRSYVRGHCIASACDREYVLLLQWWHLLKHIRIRDKGHVAGTKYEPEDT